MNEQVTIPEAAWEAVEKATYVWVDDVPVGKIRTAAVNAAAPHIDRAARIDELRLEIEINERSADQIPLNTALGGALRTHFLNEADRHRERIAELGGQGDE